jgi:hypothetical protein
VPFAGSGGANDGAARSPAADQRFRQPLHERVSGHFPATDPRGFLRSVEKSLGVKMSAVPATATQIFVVDSHAEPQPMILQHCSIDSRTTSLIA